MTVKGEEELLAATEALDVVLRGAVEALVVWWDEDLPTDVMMNVDEKLWYHLGVITTVASTVGQHLVWARETLAHGTKPDVRDE